MIVLRLTGGNITEQIMTYDEFKAERAALDAALETWWNEQKRKGYGFGHDVPSGNAFEAGWQAGSERIAEFLRDFINLCAAGDIDENSDDGLGWADLVKRAKNMQISTART